MISEILTQKLEELMSQKDHVVIAIDGPGHEAGAALALELQQKYKCNVFHTSNYNRPADELTPEVLGTPGGKLDWQRLKTEVIEPLKEGKDVVFRVFSFVAMAYMPAMPAPAKKLNIIEGVYSLHPELRPLYDLAVFVPANGGAFANEQEALYYNGVDMKPDIVL